MSFTISSRSRRILTFFSSVVVIGTFLFLLAFHKSDNDRYEQLTHELFLRSMQENTLNMHYTLAYPQAFGITEYKATLPCYSHEQTLLASQERKALLTELENLEISHLSAPNQFSYQLLTASLKQSLADQDFAYFEEPLSPSSGMQSQLPILLAEYTFRSLRDVEDYLNLLDQTDTYFEALLQYEREKADAGLLMSSVSLRKVIEQCDTILTKEALDQDQHFLQITFRERLEKLIAEQLLTEEKAAELTVLHNRLLRTVMLPAYTALGDGLLLLEDPDRAPTGLCSYPNGKEYYEHLLRSVTGSSRSMDGIRELLTDRLTLEYETIRELLRQTPSLLTNQDIHSGASLFPYQNAPQILQQLQERMREDFPALPMDQSAENASAELSAASMAGSSVAIKPVSPSLQEYCAPAFYLTPPLDDISSNAIYINQKQMPDSLELFTSLAHEGYPGHMYQTIYHNLQTLEQHTGAAPVRELLWYGGFVEGWALYVEFLAYDTAADMMQHDSAQTIRLLRHDRSLLLCIYSLLDIMIHYEGASVKEASAFLERFGITDTASVNAIYEYIVEEPVNYLKYYLGYLEILKLQQQAKEQWGNDYTDLRFHTFLLDFGPADFTTLQHYLRTEQKIK